MSRALTFSFSPTDAGWAEAGIAQSSVAVRLAVSCTTADPVGRFVTAVARLSATTSGSEQLLWDAETSAHAITISRYGDRADLLVQTRRLDSTTTLQLELSDSFGALVEATLRMADDIDRAVLVEHFRDDPWPAKAIADLTSETYGAPRES